MAIIRAFEEIDPTTEIAQLLNEEKAASELPSHDQLYIDKSNEVKESEEAEAAVSEENDTNSVESSTDEDEDADSGESEDTESSSEEDPELEEIDGKQTTVATESIRNEGAVSVIALEEIEGAVGSTLMQSTGSALWGMAKTASSYALHLATELAGMLKELGLTYGPIAFSKLRSGVSYLLSKTFKLAIKLQSVAVKQYFQYAHSFDRHQQRLRKLKETLQLLPDTVVLADKAAFNDEEVFRLFEVSGQAEPLKAVRAVGQLLDVVVNDIDRGIHNEIEVMKQVIESCKRNARVDLLRYLSLPGLSSGFMKRGVQGLDSNTDLTESFVYTLPIPKSTLLIATVPKEDVVKEAAKSGDLSNVTQAYQESYIVLAANPVRTKSVPLVNYMDKKSLLSLLAELESVLDKAKSHVSFYKKLENSSADLKPSFQNYFSWLVEDEKAKALKDSLAEVIYLKQSYVTRVYLPGAVDIHDFASNYASSVMRYVEKNIKVLKPAESDVAA